MDIVSPVSGAPGLHQPSLSEEGFRFDVPVPDGAYRWWYIDGFSDDGSAGVTLIAFVGSVFSPYYARARRRGLTNPDNYVAINAIFYGPDRKRWAMTERGASQLHRDATVFRVGPSQIRRDGNALDIEINETCVPWPSRLEGRIRVEFPEPRSHCQSLDSGGQHRWWPIAPCADIQVLLHQPSISWQGLGYVDSNAGALHPEHTFSGWHWARSELADDHGLIHYDTTARDGETRSLALEYSRAGEVSLINAESHLTEIEPTSSWGIRRAARFPADQIGEVTTYEDTPFYARSRLQTQVGDRLISVMHESLDLNRFQRNWVQTLLPFRMPRFAPYR